MGPLFPWIYVSHLCALRHHFYFLGLNTGSNKPLPYYNCACAKIRAECKIGDKQTVNFEVGALAWRKVDGLFISNFALRTNLRACAVVIGKGLIITYSLPFKLVGCVKLALKNVPTHLSSSPFVQLLRLRWSDRSNWKWVKLTLKSWHRPTPGQEKKKQNKTKTNLSIGRLLCF